MNDIVVSLADGLGFDKYGQLNVSWQQGDATYSTIIADMRGKKCFICGREWELTAEAFRRQYLDRTTNEWCHTSCFEGYVATTEAHMWYDALCKARGEARIAWSWEKIRNEYSAAWNTPWYLVKFKSYLPKVKLGTRKRVYHMSMHDLHPSQVELFLPLVEKEDVTKGTEGRSSIYIHAWTEAKALEYLRHFYTILQAVKPLEDTQGAIVTDFKLEKKV
jgi:hypothetical protein